MMKARQLKFHALGLAGIAFAIQAAPASAHHSFALFDQGTILELEGTVKELYWMNPHSWLQLMVTDSQAQEVEWSIEMGSPSSLTRDGWAQGAVQPGDQVSLKVNPLRDGSPGGAFVAIVLPNGEVVSHEYRFPPASTIPPR